MNPGKGEMRQPCCDSEVFVVLFSFIGEPRILGSRVSWGAAHPGEPRILGSCASPVTFFCKQIDQKQYYRVNSGSGHSDRGSSGRGEDPRHRPTANAFAGDVRSSTQAMLFVNIHKSVRFSGRFFVS